MNRSINQSIEYVDHKKYTCINSENIDTRIHIKYIIIKSLSCTEDTLLRVKLLFSLYLCSGLAPGTDKATCRGLETIQQTAQQIQECDSV